MASRKTKTTWAKLTREAKVRERREDKQARKEARKLEAANGPTEPVGIPADEQPAPQD